jgi:hypothetical protein
VAPGIDQPRRRRARLTAAAALLGWASFTAGLAWLTHPAVALVSLGLLLLAVPGRRVLWLVLTDGIVSVVSSDTSEESE